MATFGPTEIQSGGDDADYDYQTYTEDGTVLTVGGDEGTADEISAGWIWDISAAISSGDTINSATLTLVSDFSNDDCNVIVFAADEDNRSSWADSSGNRPAHASNTGPPETTANATASLSAAAGGTEYPITVTSIVAEVVARGGFGGHIGLIASQNSGTIEFLKLAAFENSTDNPSDLEIDYTAAAGGLSIPIAAYHQNHLRNP